MRRDKLHYEIMEFLNAQVRPIHLAELVKFLKEEKGRRNKPRKRALTRLIELEQENIISSRRLLRRYNSKNTVRLVFYGLPKIWKTFDTRQKISDRHNRQTIQLEGYESRLRSCTA